MSSISGRDFFFAKKKKLGDDLSMFTFIKDKHINIFFQNGTESGFFSDVIDSAKSSVKTAVNTVADTEIGSYLGKKILLSAEEEKLIVELEKKLKEVKGTPLENLLKTTGAISDDKASLAMRWRDKRGDSNDGREGAISLIKAIDNYKNGILTIVTYSQKEGYKAHDFNEYEQTVKQDTTSMNAGLMKGLYELRGKKMGFGEETWNQIGLYISNRPDSALIKNLPEDAKKNLLELGKKAKEEKEVKIQSELQKVWEKPEMRKVLEKRGILVGNRLDIKTELDTLKQKNAPISGIEKHFNTLADDLKKEARALLNESKEEAKRANLDKKSFSDIGITDISVMGTDGKRINISKYGISLIDDVYAGDALLAVNEWINKRDKKSPNYEQDLKNVEAIRRILAKKIEAFQKVDDATKAHLVAVKAREDGVRGINGKDFTPPADKLLEQAGEIGKARFQKESTESELRKLGISNLEEARKRINKLFEKEIGKDLSPEEEYEKRVLEQYIHDNTRIAMSHATAVRIFGEEDARRLFTESNRFVSGNPKETYNFESLEKTAVMHDPESTPGERRFAGLKPGESMPIEQILERRDSIGNYHVPEIAGTELQKNQDGTFNIKGALKAENLTKKEMQEYVRDIREYVGVGLSQLIPFMPMVTKELQRLGINTALDGQTGTTEQQTVLKTLYEGLFGKEIVTSSLGDVERSFSSSLGNPSNMRNAMQQTLLNHKLINESGGSIRPDALQQWLHDIYSMPPNYPPV